MSEWLKEHAWKACVGETLPWVRISLSPPTSFIHAPREVHMQRSDVGSLPARRSFLSRLGGSLAAFGAALGAGASPAAAQSPSSSGGCRPPRHGDDAGFDKITGQRHISLAA